LGKERFNSLKQIDISRKRRNKGLSVTKAPEIAILVVVVEKFIINSSPNLCCAKSTFGETSGPPGSS
jgi:hypothetical protein